MTTTAPETLPVIDIAPLRAPDADAGTLAACARAIDAACRDAGFFYVTGHGIASELLQRLRDESRAFFAAPEERKRDIAMAHGGVAWRGWFPLGGELTSGRPDGKEGLYFGTELPPGHPRVAAGWPLHGANLWPDWQPGLRPAVLDYIDAATRAGHALVSGIALALGQPADWFARHYTADPTILFRIFRYPPQQLAPGEAWGVGEHTDYGLLTLLAIDDVPGLQVRTPRGWIEAPPVPGALVCNIGDMLDRLTGGRYRSTPHRVANTSGRERYSFPLFFDPDFAATVTPLPGVAAADADADARSRWDGTSVHLPFDGSYGDYLLGKVGKVFPQLRGQVLERPEAER
ncbi:hypothetical protein LDO26_14645 [Luteimonas sp. BDR2-5]|uniref:isopenicillin N synthase family dioxygenase n=1 Tax=Proluteimonas luteida TaxID=2878685 RepID=UPI001E56B0D3|nr:2-oxoglutarate and iron-dependent oxygenase domain-containing protein [Luteimonas sp. BDR2-5]MCD9029431.1 hypothetical protein [Luteimonas sp. BDR2-5]